jgi:hypothetical protein
MIGLCANRARNARRTNGLVAPHTDNSVSSPASCSTRFGTFVRRTASAASASASAIGSMIALANLSFLCALRPKTAPPGKGLTSRALSEDERALGVRTDVRSASRGCREGDERALRTPRERVHAA